MHSLSFSLLALIFWNRYETTNDFAKEAKNEKGFLFCCFFYSTLKGIVRTTTASMSTALRSIVSFAFLVFLLFLILFNLCANACFFRYFKRCQTRRTMHMWSSVCWVCIALRHRSLNVTMMMWLFAVPICRLRWRAKRVNYICFSKSQARGVDIDVVLFVCTLGLAWCAMSSLKSALRVAVNRPPLRGKELERGEQIV